MQSEEREELVDRACRMLWNRDYDGALRFLDRRRSVFLAEGLEPEASLLVSMYHVRAALARRRKEKVSWDRRARELVVAFLSDWPRADRLRVNWGQHLLIFDRDAARAFELLVNLEKPRADATRLERQNHFLGQQICAFAAGYLSRPDFGTLLLTAYCPENSDLGPFLHGLIRAVEASPGLEPSVVEQLCERLEHFPEVSPEFFAEFRAAARGGN